MSNKGNLRPCIVSYLISKTTSDGKCASLVFIEQNMSSSAEYVYIYIYIYVCMIF